MDVLGTGDTYPSGWMQVALRQTKPVDGAPATIDLCPECALNMMDFIHGDAKEVQELEARA